MVQEALPQHNNKQHRRRQPLNLRNPPRNPLRHSLRLRNRHNPLRLPQARTRQHPDRHRKLRKKTKAGRFRPWCGKWRASTTLIWRKYAEPARAAALPSRTWKPIWHRKAHAR